MADTITHWMNNEAVAGSGGSQPGNQSGDRPGHRAGGAGHRRGCARGDRRGCRGVPGLAGHLAGQAHRRSCSTSANCSTPARASWPRSSPASTARSSPTPSARSSRGQEVVEFACGIPHLLKGGFTENASTKVDVYSIRQPLGAGRHHLPVQLPGHGADVVLPHRHRRRQHRRPQAVREGPRRRRCGWPSCGRRPACPPASSTCCRATRPPSTSC